MKVNGHHIPAIHTWLNVLVEKQEANLKSLPVVPIYHEFDYEQIIGMADIRIVKGVAYADLRLFEYNYIGYYPAIAFNITGSRRNIFCVGLSSKPNADKSIKALEI